MTMNPSLWAKDPVRVSQDYDARHGAGSMPGTFLWAVWTAEGSDHLEKVDAKFPGRPVPAGAPHPDVVDISHVRWATGNAITAIDLCSATLGRLFCGGTGDHELSLRSFELRTPPRPQPEVNARRTALPTPFLDWIDATLADQRYVELHGARNPFTHSWLQRHISVGGDGGHVGRTSFTVRGTKYKRNARDMVVMSAELALNRVRDFVARVDAH